MKLDSPVATAFKYTLGTFYCLVAIVILLFHWFKASLQFFTAKSRSAPKCLTNLSFDATHRHYKVNGVKLHCVVAGDERKPLMLLVHGFPEFWYSWRSQIKYFMDRYWIVAVDMRGYGDSEKPEGVENYKMKLLQKDIEELISALGRKKVDVLVAHDWGGAVSWRLVAAKPELVDKFIVANIPHPSAFLKVLKSVKKQFFMIWYIFMFQLPYLPEFLLRANDMQIFNNNIQGKKKEWKTVTDDDIEVFKYNYSKPGAFTGPVNYYRANFGDPELLKHDLTITRPTLLIWGDEDRALRVEGAHASAEFVKDFTLKLVPGAGHFVTNTHPDQVNKHMDQWLNKV